MPLLKDDVLPYPLGREIECFSPCDCPQIRDLVLLALKVGKHRQNRERVPPGEGLQVVEPDAGDCHLDLVNGPPAPVPSLPDQFCGVNTREVRVLPEFAHCLGENRDDVGLEEGTDELPFRLDAVEPSEEGDGDTAAGDHRPVDGRDIACLFRAVEPEEVSHVGDVDLEPEVGVQLLAPAAPDCGKTEQVGVVLPVKIVLDPGKCARLTADPIVIRKNRVEPPALERLDGLAAVCEVEETVEERTVEFPRRDEEVADPAPGYVVNRAPQDRHDVCDVPPVEVFPGQGMQVAGSDRHGVPERLRQVAVYRRLDELGAGKVVYEIQDVLPVLFLPAEMSDDLR